MKEMYKGVVNSPETTITNNINESDTLIYVLDETRIPEPPNLMVLGTGVSAETIKVISIDGNALTVERGFQGVPRSWNAGTVIARNFTEYDYNALMENIKTLKTKTDTNADDILDLMSYVGDLENLDTTEKANLVLALNEIYQDLVAHKVDYAKIKHNIIYYATELIGMENMDVTDELNNILTAQKGKVVMLPIGTFLLSDDIIVMSNTILRGSGIGNTILKIKDNSSAGTVATHGCITTEDLGINIIIEDLTVDGNRANQTWTPIGSANYGISIRSSNTIVQNVECKNVTGNGCGVPTNSSNVIFNTVYSHDNGKKGFHSGNVTNIHVVNGYYYNNEIDSGIGIHQGMKKACVTGNTCYNNGTYGIDLGDSLGTETSKSQEIICSNNILYDNTICGIFVNGRGDDDSELLNKHIVISKNILINNPLQLTTSKNVLIQDNYILDSMIKIQTSFNIDIKNNIITSLLNTKNHDAMIKIEGIATSGSNLVVGDHINIVNNTLNIGSDTWQYGIVAGSHTNLKIVDNDINGSASVYPIRVYNKAETAFIKHNKGVIRVESDYYNNGFNNYDLLTVCTSALRPKKARVGEQVFDTTLGKPIFCKTSAVIDESGIVTTNAIWVDATGTTV